MTIADRIKFLRKSLRMNQFDFAKELGLKQGSISKIEKSKNNPTERLLLGICRAFGVNYDWLTKGVGEYYSDPSTTQIRESQAAYKTSDRVLNLWIDILIRIFEEGDKSKIEALKAQLRALDPSAKKQNLPKKEDASIDKKAM